MKNLMTVAIATILLSLSPSCGGADSLSNDAMDATKEFVELLEGIDSKESAEAAGPQLKEVAARMKALQGKMEALSEEERKEMQAAVESSEEGKELQERMIGAMGKLMMSPEIGQALAPVMEALDN